MSLSDLFLERRVEAIVNYIRTDTRLLMKAQAELFGWSTMQGADELHKKRRERFAALTNDQQIEAINSGDVLSAIGPD